MIVLHILEATLGGTRRYIENIAAVSDPALIQSGLVYTTNRSDEQFPKTLEYCRTQNWDLFEVDMVRAMRPIQDFQAVLNIRKVIQSFKPDIVHCHSSKGGGLGRLAVRTLSGKRPLSLYTPNALAVYPYARMLERFLAPLTDLYVAASESEKREIEQTCRVNAEKITIVSPGIEIDQYYPADKHEARKRLNLDPNLSLIVGVGRLSAQKDPIAFVRIIKEIVKENPGLKAMWVGEGELRKAVEEEIRVHQLTNTIQITGWQLDVRPYITAADLVLIPSVYEGCPYTVVETSALGRPVVGSRVSGIVDVVVEQETGRLFERQNQSEAARECLELLSDTQLQLRMGLRGREVVCEKFTLPVMGNNLLKSYQYALEKSR